MALTRSEDTRTGDIRPVLGPVTGTPTATATATATDVMISEPKTLAGDATVGRARTAFVDDHVHMLLLVDGPRLVGTLVRDDLPDDCAPDDPALTHARLHRRTVAPDADAETIRRDLIAAGRRRLAVVTGAGVLLGLVCLKRNETGFCSDEGVANRAAGRLDPC